MCGDADIDIACATTKYWGKYNVFIQHINKNIIIEHVNVQE